MDSCRSRWYFTEEQLANSPSRRCGINAEQELSYRQRAANLIQEMGQRLQVSQLCINTAIVYMHRFYAFHSFTVFHRNMIAAAAFFLAAKVEEQPRKLEHVIKIMNILLEKTESNRETFAEQSAELVFNENVLLQTLGFDVAIDHPHTHVVRACQLFNIVTAEPEFPIIPVSRELRQTCYFMASNSLHLTTMCLKYRPTVVAAFCIYIACKWSRWEIPDSSEGKVWYSYVDEDVTPEILKKLTDEYLQILERSPSKFKSKMKAITSNGQAGNLAPNVNRDDGPSTSGHHKASHDKHHHHHRSGSNSSNSSVVNRKPEVPKQGTAQAPGYKPRPAQSSSTSNRPPYPGMDSNSGPSKPVNEERTQHRQLVETQVYAGIPRQMDSMKQRPPSTASSSAHPPLPQQRHSLSSKPAVDYHPKPSVKHPPMPQPQMQQKKPSWPQQPPPQQSNLSKMPSSHVQASHSQPNLGSTSNSLNNASRTMSLQSLPSYNESTKSQNSSQQAPAPSSLPPQPDYWFNEKQHVETQLMKQPSPPRQIKSLFSPSPEHETSFDRNKAMMMATNIKRESPKNEKQERKSSTPSKKSQNERKPSTATVKSEPDLQKKRPFAMMNEGNSNMNEFNQESKTRKLDPAVVAKNELTQVGIKQQPIETNPDAVKSLLQECFQDSSNKFDSFGADSPLDIINPEPVSIPQPAVQPESSHLPKPAENGFDDDHHKHSKSKKKKDKHKKKKKSHKGDREDRGDCDEKSPEVIHAPPLGLKIKIPIKDVNKSDLAVAPPHFPPAPLKLKISKDKIGNFNESYSSSGSSSSKKKDKDKERSRKEKERKHGGSHNNNNSEIKEDKMNINLQQTYQPTLDMHNGLQQVFQRGSNDFLTNNYFSNGSN